MAWVCREGKLVLRVRTQLTWAPRWLDAPDLIGGPRMFVLRYGKIALAGMPANLRYGNETNADRGGAISRVPGEFFSG